MDQAILRAPFPFYSQLLDLQPKEKKDASNPYDSLESTGKN